KNLGLNKLKSNQKTTIGEPVFQRIDTKKWEKVIVMNKEEEKKLPEDNVVELIEFPDFKKVDLRVAKIEEAEDIVKSNKLLKLKLDVGELGKRQIVAGIKKYYSPEDLVGKKIIIVANLKPAKLMGIESQGMLLAAKNEEELTVLTVDRDIEPGLRVS
ncbi:MAG: methionyl-tRNA synthetase, partial [Geotoga sp.]|nr:methionyl-tRNA synthetase [Geotoga sp.]